jgi:hypothetical protein
MNHVPSLSSLFDKIQMIYLFCLFLWCLSNKPFLILLLTYLGYM